MEKKPFGTLADGTEVSLYSFTNKNGMTMTVTELGATLVGLLVPDRDGNPVDVVLGYDTPQEYIDGGCYFGAVIAPNGNRIDKGKFQIGDKTYQLPINDNENNLHSGPHGVDERVWEVAKVDEEANCISFHIMIPDGDNGFPGNLDTTVTYTLTKDGAVSIHYEAVSDADTIANMTNHSYFNLAGHASGSIEDHTLILNADHYTPVIDSQAIPTGEIAPVVGTPMD
ncbi:MAG: galactose mutarotase, partial [Lachnospiraceae bacterium]|nr:galactose mutarotase [Lachnospiraceae bacterium]